MLRTFWRPCRSEGKTAGRPPAASEPPRFAVTGEHPCDPVGEIRFICGLVSPEDVAVVPGAEWVRAP